MEKSHFLWVGAREAVVVSELADLPDVIEFQCPRCTARSSERYYGPCTACRTDMRNALGGERRDVAAAAYEPKMNVTPNAVATKE